VATIGVTLQTGSTTEQLVVRDVSNAVSIQYPFDVSGFAFHVLGYSTQYYLQDANMDNVPAVYSAGTTNYDNLLTDSTTLTGSVGDVSVTLPISSSVTNSAAYAVTGVYGGYAQAAAPLVPNLFFQKPAGDISSAPVSFWIILDYGNGPSGPITDYNYPISQTTVYSGGQADVAAAPGWTKITAAAPVTTGPVTFANLGSQQFMTNGQIIVRVWDPSAGTTVFMRYQSPSGPASLSYVTVPYSNANTQPVKGAPTTAEYLAGSSATINYVISNVSFAGITFVRFDIPADASATSQWNFTRQHPWLHGFQRVLLQPGQRKLDARRGYRHLPELERPQHEQQCHPGHDRHRL
jgi:hypothetical protein